MKIIRINNNMVVEIMPIADLTEAEQLYHPVILAQCIEAPDVVAVGWQYIDGEWSEPEHIPIASAEPDLPLENYLVELDFRLSLIELGVI